MTDYENVLLRLIEYSNDRIEPAEKLNAQRRPPARPVDALARAGPGDDVR
jgi:hypothetical protein